MTAAFVQGDTRIAGARVGLRLILGTPPGVLFRVTRECTRGVSLRFRFAVGFCDCKIGGAFKNPWYRRDRDDGHAIDHPLLLHLCLVVVHPLFLQCICWV